MEIDNGENGSYYDLDLRNPVISGSEPGMIYCADIVTALEMTHAEGEAFMAIWRKAAQRQGRGKAGNTALRDAQKVRFYGDLMVKTEQFKQTTRGVSRIRGND